jgi:glycosyltransferase involved in cell wall biosynthesis
MEIGGVEPGSRRTALEQLATELGLSDSLIIHGAVPRPQYLERIARSRLTVSCSRFESFGLPVAEALTMGAPVLCSDIPAHRELLARAGAGEAFAAGDVTALAARLRQALHGELPPRLSTPPLGWDWATRGREHIDAYARYVVGTR